VVVLGGAFSGAATPLLLRREAPQLRVLIVERAARVDEKVGEATTEMSAMSLARRLACWEPLEREQLPKEALRYDPDDSPGLDHAAFTAEATAAIVRADAAGEDVRPRIAEHDATFNLERAPYRMLLAGLRLWLAAELDGLRLRARAGRGRVGNVPAGAERISP
jgi:hypothetical protein